MGRQFRHDTPSLGAPCSRCGLVYSQKTAYVPCFEEGDTFETWKAKQPEELQELLRPPPAGTKPRNVFIDGKSSDLEGAERVAARALQQLVPPSMRRQTAAADVAITDLSTLIVAHIQDAMDARPWVADLEVVLAERDRLAARVKELEAELVANAARR